MDLTKIIHRLQGLPGPWTRYFDESRRRHVFTPPEGEPVALRDREYLKVMEELGPVPMPAGGVALDHVGSYYN